MSIDDWREMTGYMLGCDPSEPNIFKEPQAMNYLNKLIQVAEASRTTIEVSATQQGLSITVTAHRGSMSEPTSKSANFWIDKNEKDMTGRLEHFLKLVQ